jgi:predicted permease
MVRDVRFALRLLAKDLSFTVTALLTLAVCIGANTAMFTIARSVLLKPLPFPESERLVLLYNSYPNAGVPRVGASTPDYFDRREAVRSLDQLAVFRNEGATLGDAGGAERLVSLRATPSLFRMLGAQPVQGRIFTEAEGEPGQPAVVLLSFGFWQRKFGDVPAVDETIRLNGTEHQVIGVLPRDFTFLADDVEVYLPAVVVPPPGSAGRHSNNWQMVGRLAPGATIDRARQQVDALNAANDERFPEFRQALNDAGFRTVVVLLQEDVIRDVKAALYLLWGGVLFVLVIGGVNLANLVVVRASGRMREMATRHALGADLGRLARQLVTETSLLAVAGGLLGLLVGWWSLRSLTALELDQLPRGYEIALDPTGIAAMLGLTLLVGIVLGLAPVARLRRMNVNVDLREDNRGGTAGRRASLLRSGLATVQVAIALVVLVGAGLLFASFRAVMRTELGFEPANVATIAVSLPGTSYGDAAGRVSFEQRVLAAVRALPEVEAAGGTTVVPFSGSITNSVILGEGHEMKPGESLLAPTMATVTDGYFESLGVRLLEGRFFDRRDTADATNVVIIDDRLAEAFWPGRSALGRRLYRPEDPRDLTKITPETDFFTIVGIIDEMQMIDPRGDVTPVGAVYFPYGQNATNNFTLAVRSRAGAGITNAVRATVAQIDLEVAVFLPRTLPEWIDRALVGRRVPMLIAVAFAAVALFLSAVGVYGVLAYGVVQRHRELGVRLALGGTAGRIFGLVLGRGVKIVAIGIAAGLAGAYLLGQLMTSQLYGITSMDPLVLLLVTATLSGAALLASVVPAWRASRIDPIVALSR